MITLLFKQRMFSWLDSYDIFDENNNVVYTVKGQLALGHKLNIYDTSGKHIATLQQRIFCFMPKFDIYLNGTFSGTVSREFTFLKPKYTIKRMGWYIEGNPLEWNYTITASGGRYIASVSKEFFKWTDTYKIYIVNPEDVLPSLMFVLAIDAEKCSRAD